MFSFVLWDKKEEKMFCARDPFGIKPFYYYQKEDTLLFASEIKSFLEHPSFEKELNEKLIPSYLSFSFTPTTETFFKNVFKYMLMFAQPKTRPLYQNLQSLSVPPSF